MIHGIINVRKEKGYTSHDVVAKLRGIVGQKKIGHTGTLDPDAEGALPVCLGKATKVCDLLTNRDKTYEAVLLLGKTTDTQDISGVCLEERSAGHLTEGAVKEAVHSFEGEYEQIPPMYSALKVNGKKLYELAREGKNVERKGRRVKIRRIRILEIRLPRVRMEVACSKGTYIRTLCHDIGESLGTGGCMESLIRTKAGDFSLEDSHTLAEIEKLKEEGRLKEILISVEEMFRQYRRVIVSKELDSLLYNGNTFFLPKEPAEPTDGELVRACDSKGRFVAIYRYCGQERKYKTEKMFFTKQETEEI